MATDNAVIWQKIEGALVLIAALATWYWAPETSVAPMHWAIVILVFFAPDLSFLAYLAGPRIGAMGYNAVHLYGFGAAIAAGGLILCCPLATSIGLLWFGHAGMDRAFGYGLKLPEGFAHTHLGMIGKSKG